MTTPLEAAYFSAVLLAGGLGRHAHAKAAEAVALKEVLARAITHPDSLREAAFREVWDRRSQFSDLNFEGELGETLAKHARVLTETNL